MSSIQNTTTSTTVNTDFEVRSLDAMCVNESNIKHKWYYNLKYTTVGIAFGIIFVKAEIISWFRIQSSSASHSAPRDDRRFDRICS